MSRAAVRHIEGAWLLAPSVRRFIRDSTFNHPFSAAVQRAILAPCPPLRQLLPTACRRMSSLWSARCSITWVRPSRCCCSRSSRRRAWHGYGSRRPVRCSRCGHRGAFSAHSHNATGRSSSRSVSCWPPRWAWGVSSSVVPYVCDQLTMRRLPRASFALLLSLLPTRAACVGVVVLRQVPSMQEVLGVLLVIGGVAPHRSL